MSGAAETGLVLDGLRCAGCAQRVERELADLPGVEEVRVNYTTQRALVRFDPARIEAAALGEHVRSLGYGVTLYDPASLERPAQHEARHALARVLVSGFLAGNVMVLSLALYLGSYQGIEPGAQEALRWLAIALSLPAVTYCAWPFWLGALSGLRRAELTIDVPVVLGIVTAFVASVLGTLSGTLHVFMDSATAMVFVILLGRTLERAARARAASAVERLVALAPPTALRRDASGISEVAVESLAPGDRVIVPPGARVPVDGRIVAGETELDESLLTGESLPAARGTGSVASGGTCNVLAEIEIEVMHPANAGTLARLAALLERAQSERPRIQHLADRVAAIFAPSVLLVAGAVALQRIITGASALEIALTAAAVLIVACPCALALATPAAITAAIGRAAGSGILFKSGEALERTASVDRVLLDKTGTLTEGRLRVLDALPAAGTSREELLALAVRAEGASVHPIAEAIRQAAGVDATADTTEAPRRTRAGLGVVAGDLIVGSRQLLEEQDVARDPALEEAAAKLSDQGLSLAWVSRAGRVEGVIGLADTPRPDALAALRRLEAQGIRVTLVTGDHAEAARHAAAQTGLKELQWAVTPEGKVECVRAAREAGARVLVAGDGINDAAAMAAADVAVAFARGADVAIEAADIVVHAPRLRALPDAIELSRLTLRRIRQNLSFAVVYNLLAVPLAASGVLHPVHAAIAMGLSSLIVTGNSVRLLGWEPR